MATEIDDNRIALCGISINYKEPNYLAQMAKDKFNSDNIEKEKTHILTKCIPHHKCSINIDCLSYKCLECSKIIPVKDYPLPYSLKKIGLISDCYNNHNCYFTCPYKNDYTNYYCMDCNTTFHNIDKKLILPKAFKDALHNLKPFPKQMHHDAVKLFIKHSNNNPVIVNKYYTYDIDKELYFCSDDNTYIDDIPYPKYDDNTIYIYSLVF